MAEADAQGVDTRPFPLEKHVTAVGAIATLTSGAVSFFMTDYRSVGYILAGTSLVLSALVAFLRSMDLGAKYLKATLLIVVVAIGFGSLALLWHSYEHPAPKTPVVQVPAPVAPAPTVNQSDSHDSYQVTTSGKNSPVITGGNAPISIGDHYEQPPKKEKKAQ